MPWPMTTIPGARLGLHAVAPNLVLSQFSLHVKLKQFLILTRRYVFVFFLKFILRESEEGGREGVRH